MGYGGVIQTVDGENALPYPPFVFLRKSISAIGGHIKGAMLFDQGHCP
jgi:hypothetical protein